MGFKFLNILKTIITENSSDGDVNVEFTFRDIKPWIKYPMNRIYFNNLSLKSGRETIHKSSPIKNPFS
jgi:hypothetical protein